MTRKIGLVILADYSLPSSSRNLNAYQRVFYGRQWFHLALVARRNAEIAEELKDDVELHRAPFDQRAFFLLYAFWKILRLRISGFEALSTGPTISAFLGLISKLLLGYFWILDVWDPPGRRPTQPTKFQRKLDRLLSLAMRRANFFIISGLGGFLAPIDPPGDRCLYLQNGIDIGQAATRPPAPPSGGPLRIAYSKQAFRRMHAIPWIIKAVEIASPGRCFEVNLYGTIESTDLEALRNSSARASFHIHGRVEGPMTRFYREVHIGLATILPIDEGPYHFPVKVLEHLSQGNPVIASDLPNMRAMITHGYNGVLVNPGDTAALANALMSLHDGELDWNEMAVNALQSVLQFDAAKKHRVIAEEIVQRMRKRG